MRSIWYDKGSARRLVGNVYILCIFVTEELESKEKAEWAVNRQNAWKAVCTAMAWLQKYARRYRKQLDFRNGVIGLDKEWVHTIPSDYDSGHASPDFVKNYLEALGYPTGKAFADWVCGFSGCEQAFVLVIANKRGRGYAVPHMSNDGSNYSEGAILYDGGSFHVMPNQVAHEILHLFGAWDLYHTREQSQENEDRMRRMYPNEVMLKSAPIEQLTISPLTAWLVGLTDEEQPWFQSFRPNNC